MPLSNQQLDAVASVLTTIAPGTNPLPELRRKLGGIPVTRCDAADMSGETPYQRLPAFDLFLIDAASHCWRLVDDPSAASGFIVAARCEQAQS